MNDNSKEFYIYGHYTLDTNELFYIGKGKGYRYNDLCKRNVIWNRIYKKHGRRVEILIDNLEEPDALIQEILGIMEYKPRANITKGGEGSSGYKFSNDRKILHSQIAKKYWKGKVRYNKGKKGHKMTEEQKNKYRFSVTDKIKGKTITEIYGEEKAGKIIEKMKLQKYWNKGLKMSDEYNEKLSKAHNGFNFYVYLKQDMSFLGEWTNINKCGRDFDINPGIICRYLKGYNQNHPRNKCPYFFSKERL